MEILPTFIAKAISSRIDTHYPLIHTKELDYGTSGIRTKGAVLPPVSARLIFIAVLRSWSCGLNSSSELVKERGSSIGFIITASHNPSDDNGFKIIDSDGAMLKSSWEKWCKKAVNAKSGGDLINVLKECITEENITFPSKIPSSYGSILFGRDTRETGLCIFDSAKDMLDIFLKVPYTDYGIVTTPELHYIVCKFNLELQKAIPAAINIDSYHQCILNAFDRLMSLRLNGAPINQHNLVIDTSNGVGYHGMKRLISFSESISDHDILKKYFNIILLNTNVEQSNKLNDLCGAEFVHKKDSPSDEMNQWAVVNHKEKNYSHYYSLDGDADRLIALNYNSLPSERGKWWNIIDGDRISVLYALLLHKWLGDDVMELLDVGIVLTGYSNGAVTRFIEETLKMKTYVTATGVKNLHPVAHKLDIGIYFETNGHGTVLFRDGLEKKLEGRISTQKAEFIYLILKTVPLLLSQVCGDAIADILMCEVALDALQLSPLQWIQVYDARPSIQSRISLPDSSVITTTKVQTRVITPKGLQDEIDDIINSLEQEFPSKDREQGMTRAFVRPSGTEPVVRIYAETSTKNTCKVLEEKVRAAVIKYCS
ncbi:unnamed protein product [Phytomonas sp. Hart1]|nr:unnamed protein product [Phytomonas sp. Hart1]|eukprot:CCW72282.1 unnamed protein product [Phytomonas sp. isolate Hart1]